MNIVYIRKITYIYDIYAFVVLWNRVGHKQQADKRIDKSIQEFLPRHHLLPKGFLNERLECLNSLSTGTWKLQVNQHNLTTQFDAVDSQSA